MFFRKNLFDFLISATPDDFYWKYSVDNYRNLPDMLNKFLHHYYHTTRCHKK
ncbi:MAG TPA: hypothetical protein PLV27_07430 [Anaerolineaceae bacterium]|nr:hypothetical protein [Anaerolineaceae bacterium]